MTKYAEFKFNKKFIIFVFSILSRNTYSYIAEHSLGNSALIGSCKEQVPSHCLEYTISQRREDRYFGSVCVDDR
jgi:hypothetical protein